MDRAHVAVRPEGDVVVVAVAGEVDHGNVVEVEREVRARAAGADAAVIDLAGVTWFDSAGVAMLDRVLGLLARAGVRARVVAPEGTRARFILRIVAFPDEVLTDRVDEAVTALR